MTAVNQGGNNIEGDNGAHVHIAVGADAEQSFFLFYSIATLSLDAREPSTNWAS